MITTQRLAGVLAALCLGAAQAQTTDPLIAQARLAQARASAPHFTLGGVTYQVVPGAMLTPRPAETSGDAVLSTRSRTEHGASNAIGRFGDYDIVLGATSQQPATRAAKTRTDLDYSVIVNLRSGLPALLGPRLELQVEIPGLGQSLANALGGKLVHRGSASGMVVLEFDSADAALRALPHATAQPGVVHAQPEIIRAIPKPR